MGLWMDRDSVHHRGGIMMNEVAHFTDFKRTLSFNEAMESLFLTSDEPFDVLCLHNLRTDKVPGQIANNNNNLSHN